MHRAAKGTRTLSPLTPAQRAMGAALAPPQALTGPLGVWLRSPELCPLIEALVQHARTSPVLSKRASEIVVLSTARFAGAALQWNAHLHDALALGIPAAALRRWGRGDVPDLPSATDAVTHRFVSQLLERHVVDDATFEEARKLLGITGLVEVIGATGIFFANALVLRAFRIGSEHVFELPAGDGDDGGEVSSPSRRRATADGSPRFSPRASLTSEQADAVAQGSSHRSSLQGPFQLWIESPALFQLVERLATYCQQGTMLPPRVRELALMTTARCWDAPHPWVAHHDKAIASGLSREDLASLAEGAEPVFSHPSDRVVFDFTRSLLIGSSISDATFDVARRQLGEDGVIDLVASIGTYAMNAMILNAFELPLRAGADAPFTDLAGGGVGT